jgi:hypothetical protein
MGVTTNSLEGTFADAINPAFKQSALLRGREPHPSAYQSRQPSRTFVALERSSISLEYSFIRSETYYPAVFWADATIYQPGFIVPDCPMTSPGTFLHTVQVEKTPRGEIVPLLRLRGFFLNPNGRIVAVVRKNGGLYEQSKNGWR